MNNQLAIYFKSFNEQLTDDLGSRFDYAKLLSYGKKYKKVLAVKEDALDLSWIDEIEEIMEKIKAIVNNVNPNIDPEATFKLSEFDTFEDRYIVFLIDKISDLLAVTSSNIAGSTRKLSDYFINRRIHLNEMKLLNGVEVLNNNTSLSAKEQRKLVQVRETIGRLMDTNYYIKHKECSLFDDECVCVNSVLASEPLYNECYEFYDRLKELSSLEYNLPDPIRNIDYQNYAFLALLLAFDERGFVLSGTSPEFDNKDYLLRIKNLKLARKNITVTISADSDDHIDLLFEDNAEYKQKGKIQSKVSIDLYSSLNKELPTVDEARLYFTRKAESRCRRGYDNAFVITTILGAQNDNVIVSSPIGESFDANLGNMIESCLVNFPADNYIYSRTCPICGGHAESKGESNYVCSICNSKYMLLSDKDKKEIVWVKRLKNLEGK